MTQLKILILFIFSLGLVACSSLGFPPVNFAKNKIHHGIYRGPIGSQSGLGSFSVKVPQASSDLQFPYMQMKEDIGTDNTYVSFGPAATDFSIYRVMVGVRDQIPFSQFKSLAFPRMQAMITESYGEPIQKVYQKNLTLKGHPALYVVYTQKIPGNSDLSAMQKTKETVLTHAIYYIYYKKYLVTLWIMGNSTGLSNPITDKNRSQLIHQTWKPALQFVNSFRLYR